MNEEVVVVNQELKSKVEEISQLNADLSSFIAATEIGSVFLDRALRIVRFTPHAADLYHVTASDVGRPIGQVGHVLAAPVGMDAMAKSVLETGEPAHQVVETQRGRWYALRVSPYRDEEEDSVLGVVLTFHDVTTLKKTERQLEERSTQQRIVGRLSLHAVAGMKVADLVEEAASQLSVVTGALLTEVWMPQLPRNAVEDAAAYRLIHPTRVIKPSAPLGYGSLTAEPFAYPAQAEGQSVQGPRPDPWLAFALREERSVVSPDLDAEARFAVPQVYVGGLEDGASGIVLVAQESDAPCVIRLVARGRDTFGDAAAELLRGVGTALVQAWRSERASVLSESHFRQIEALYAYAPVGVGYVDEDYRFVRVNERLAEIDGSSAAEQLGRTIEEVRPDLWPTLKPLYDRLFATGEPLLDQLVRGAALSTGEEGRVYRASYYPDTDENGTVCGVSIVVQDVTEAKRAEDSLRDTAEEARLQASEITALYRTAPVGLVLIDRDRRVVRMNDFLASLSGVEPGVADGRMGREVVTESIAQQVDALVDRVFETGEAVEAQEIVGQIAGREGLRFFSAGYYPVFDDSGAVSYVTGVVEDVTEKKQQREQLLERERSLARQAEELLALYERAPFGVAVIGFEPDEAVPAEAATFSRVNVRFAELLGTTAEALEGEPLSASATPLAEQVRRAALQVLRTGTGIAGRRTTAPDPDDPDSERVVLIDSYPLFGERGGQKDVRAVSCIVQDVTEQSRRAQELQRLTHQLEAQVREQTYQLRAMMTDLTFAEDEERRRIGLVLHDEVQQILYGAQLKLQILLPELGNLARDESTEHLLYERLDALRDLLQDALEATRSLTADITPPQEIDEYPFEQLLEWLGGDVERRFGLPVEVVVAQRMPEAGTDVKLLLFRMVREMLFNVVKHADATKATLTLTPEDDTYLRMEVADDGKGFDDPKVVAGGPGAAKRGGLSTVRRRLKIIGGRLEVESVEGQSGARLVIYAPYTALEDAA
jgi:PAS domain S-box-containing protein